MNKSLPHEDPPDWRRYLVRIGIWFAFVAALAYAVSSGEFTVFQDDVHLALEPNRDTVPLAGQAPVIEVKVSLRNNTASNVTLKAASACKMFRWQIFDRAGDMIQSKVNEETCPTTEVSAILPPDQKLEEFYAIALVPQRYTAGHDYLVRYWYWGYEGEFQFKAE
jgi:hypothetical protein